MSEIGEGKLTRRNILVGFAGIAASGVAAKLGYDHLYSGRFSEDEIVFPKEAEVYKYLADVETDTFGTIQRVENPEPLDPNYLPKLFEQLRNNKGSVESRAKTVVDNINRTGSGSTSLMIDEGGIFLAAGHTYGSLPLGEFQPMTKFFITWMLNPSEEKSYLIRQTVVQPGVDIAIVYAPTGRPFKPLPIAIAASNPQKGEEMWSYGIYRGRSGEKDVYGLATLHGNVVPPAKSEWVEAYKDMFLVEELRPFGGMSGAPLIDRQGKLRGVMSGGYPNEATMQKDFLGARVANIRGIDTLTKNLPNSLYTIPRTFDRNE